MSRPVLITGASSGIGRALSLWFARQGHEVYACARRTSELDALAAEGKREGHTIHPVTLDVADAAATVKALERLDAEAGGLWGVVANAGVGEAVRAKRISWEKVERILQVNVVGAAATLTALAPRMAERKEGRLAGVASLAAFRGMPKLAAYSASKAFLVSFLESLRVDLRGTGVKVTTLCPGYVKSEMTANNGKMPFLLETDDAAARMGKAVERGVSSLVFPWQMALSMRALRLLPDALFDPTARKLF